MSGAAPDFGAAAAAGIVTPAQAEALAAFYRREESGPRVAPAGRATFDVAHVLWYAGALIVIGAMGLFSTLAFSAMGGGALTATALAYAVGLTFAGRHLWRRGLTTPGGLLVACAVGMAPLATYGVQDALGWWRGVPHGAYRDYYVWIKSGWMPMEVATLAAALVAIRRFPFGFVAMLAATALWFLSMDLGDWVAGPATGGDPHWEIRRRVSLGFGLGLVVLAWAVDLRQRRADYAFWLHLAGIATFWGALTATSAGGEAAKLVYALLNAGLVALGLFLGRRVYAVFGAFGIALYLGHLADRVFANSPLFPFALSLIGLAVIGLGLLYRRGAARIEAALERWLPEAARALRPPHVRGMRA